MNWRAVNWLRVQALAREVEAAADWSTFEAVSEAFSRVSMGPATGQRIEREAEQHGIPVVLVVTAAVDNHKRGLAGTGAVTD